ncbi:MAG: polymer-forming cytoskeletal protein [Gemmatimonadetes bacterium]|nr:polymer-forming cytoskeletal protein [Gemmatimonadota bacterium]
MPTSNSRPRLYLTAAFLLGIAPAVDAQVRAPTPPPPPPAPGAPSAVTQGSKSVFTGDHTIAAGETVDDVVVVGGDLRVQGTVTGDAVVVGGHLVMEESGLVQGDATVTGGSIVENGGRIRGEMRMLDRPADAGAVAAAGAGDDEPEDDDEQWGRDMAGHEGERDHRGRWFGDHGRSPFSAIAGGFSGLISVIAFGLVLAGIGALLIFYGRSYLDTVSDTIRASTLRSGAVGLAASFLLIPAFVVLVVALAVSIIGIPFLLVAVPLYPLAVASAAGMGLLSAAHAVGERTSEQRNTTFDFRYRNAYAYLFTGLGMLLAPLVAANLIEMTGFLGFIGILLEIATWAVIWAATTIGLGAVILSRAGTRRTFVAQPQMDLGFDTDPGFGAGPTPDAHV